MNYFYEFELPYSFSLNAVSAFEMASLSKLFQCVIDLLMDHHIYMHSNKIRKKLVVGGQRY